MVKSKYLSQKLIVLIICGLLLCSMQACFACTAVYIGPNVSADGSVIFARSNDCQEVWEITSQ